MYILMMLVAANEVADCAAQARGDLRIRHLPAGHAEYIYGKIGHCHVRALTADLAGAF